MRTLLLMLGIPDMGTGQMLILLGVIALAALVLGWMADMALRDGGFGIILNSAIVLAGAVGGVLLWRKLGYSVTIHPQLASAIAGGVSGMVLLIGSAVSRRFL
jgi:hypothetical protein